MSPRVTLASGFLLLALAGMSGAEVSFEPELAVGGYGIGRQSFDHPADVVQDRDEVLYVVDRGNNRIEVLDRRGQYLTEWGGRGSAPGKFESPNAITLAGSAGPVYVVDTMNHRVQKFDLRGKFLQAFGSLGSGNGDFNRPLDIALDRKGYIYVADTGNDRIQKFDPSGRFLVAWGKYARRGVEISTPVSVAFSDEGFGCIYVLTSPDCRVQKYDTEGNLLKMWPMHRKGEGLLCGPSRIRIEPRKYTVYIADTENDRVTLFDRDGELLGSLRGAKVPFRKPGGLYISDIFEETVFVADTGNNLIQKARRER